MASAIIRSSSAHTSYSRLSTSSFLNPPPYDHSSSVRFCYASNTSNKIYVSSLLNSRSSVSYNYISLVMLSNNSSSSSRTVASATEASVVDGYMSISRCILLSNSCFCLSFSCDSCISLKMSSALFCILTASACALFTNTSCFFSALLAMCWLYSSRASLFWFANAEASS